MPPAALALADENHSVAIDYGGHNLHGTIVSTLVINVTPYLIAIAGPSGSGKSTLAGRLTELLDADSAVIALDSYYHPQSGLALAQRAARNYDHPDALDWALLEHHLHELLAGRPIDAPVYLFDQHTRAEATRRMEPRPYLILEGILALHRAEIRSAAALKTFVTASSAECFRRRVERDIAERGRTRASVIQQYQSTVWPMALSYVLPTEAYADLVVSGEVALDTAARAVLERVAPRSRRTGGGAPDR
jgi:uridine kinase